YVEIDGPVDPVVFEAALRQVVDETDALHGRFVETREGPRQVIELAPDWLMPVVDVSHEPDPPGAARAWMTADMARPMDLARGPLFSYALIKVSRDCFWWYQGYHHIVIDGFGLSLMARRLAEVYTALASGQIADPGQAGSLTDLLQADQSYRASEHFAMDRDYWVGRLADPPEPARVGGRSTELPEHVIQCRASLPSSALQQL